MREGEDWFVLRYIEHIYNPTWARLDGLLIGATLAAIRLHRPAWWRWMTARGWAVLFVGLLLVTAAASLFEGLVTQAGAIIGFPLLSLGLGCVLVGMASPAILPGRIEPPGAGGGSAALPGGGAPGLAATRAAGAPPCPAGARRHAMTSGFLVTATATM